MAGLSNLKNLTQLANAARGVKGKEVLTVPVDDVVSEEQVRTEFHNLEELGASIISDGQQSPIIVSPKREDGKYVIQKGERRWRACKLVGVETIDILVNDRKLTDMELIASQLIENVQREDLPILDIARAIERLLQGGWEQKEAAEFLGKSQSWVSAHYALLKMPECVLELYTRGVTKDVELLNNLRVLYKLNADHCRMLCAIALDSGEITRKQSAEAVRAAKDKKKAAKQQAKQLKGENEEHKSGAAGVSEEDVAERADPPIGEDLPQDDPFAASDTSEHEVDRKPARRSDDTTQDVSSPPKENERKAHGEGWRAASPTALVISVNVRVEGETYTGALMMDRVARDPEMVWVQLNGPRLSEMVVCVPVTDVELARIEA